jgi:hypothetical protein
MIRAFARGDSQLLRRRWRCFKPSQLRRDGETSVAPTRYPYQFAANYQKYGDHVDQLPVDAHLLIALIAPRPLLLQTGDTDFWSDPKGEWVAAVAAGPVYRLLGQQRDLDTDQMPAAGQPIMHTLGYYMHAGGHGDHPVRLGSIHKVHAATFASCERVIRP